MNWITSMLWCLFISYRKDVEIPESLCYDTWAAISQTCIHRLNILYLFIWWLVKLLYTNAFMLFVVASYFYPAPDEGTGYCFRPISLYVYLFIYYLFVSLFLCQQDYEKTAGPICPKFSGKVWSDHGTTWFDFGSIRANGSAGQLKGQFLSPDIAIWLECCLLAVLCCHLVNDNVMKLLFCLLLSQHRVCCASHHSLFRCLLWCNLMSIAMQFCFLLFLYALHLILCSLSDMRTHSLSVHVFYNF